MTTPRRGTGRRLGLIGYVSILRNLQLTPMTAEALAIKHGLTRDRAYRVLNGLHAVKLVRVKDWAPHPTLPQRFSAVWAFGGQPDAAHPSSAYVARAEASNNLGPTVITLSYLLREMVRSTCKSQLIAATGTDAQMIAKLLAHGESIGFCYVSRWELKQGGATAMWRLGDRPSVPKPEPKSRSTIYRESYQRRKVRRQQQATFHALAHQLATPFGGLLP